MAAFCPDFERDIFISYAHIDNRATGWVQSFENSLRDAVSELVGADVSVWRDTKLGGMDQFDDVISRSVTDSAVFVAIVSPRYVQSDSCRKEYQAFVNASRPVRIQQKSRIARIRKTPLPAGLSEPVELAPDQTLGFEFFEEKDGQVVYYENNEGFAGYERFFGGVKRVAASIEKVLRLIKSDYRPREQRQIVFLAESVKALSASREELKREILGRGHRVVPEKPLLEDGAFARDVAVAAVSEATLAVHLIGGSYGVMPEGQEHSLPHLQYTLAAEKKLPQLVWIAPDSAQAAPAPDSRLASFVQQISHAEAQEGRSLDVCATDFSSFKEVLLDSLRKDHDPISTVTQGRSVYLLFHDKDIDSADLRAIRKHLLQAGYPVNVPVFEAADGELRAIEEQLILDNDATLIYYGNATDSWIAQKRRFVLTALGGAQRGAQNRRGVYLCTPKTKSKELTFGDFVGGKALPEAKGFTPLYVFGDGDTFSNEKLAPLLAWLSG